MVEGNFEKCIGGQLISAAHAYERAVHAELLPEEITNRQYEVLRCLIEVGKISQVELAQFMNVEPSTITKVLDRMERDQLLVRETCPPNRRSKYVRLLPKAQVLWQRIIDHGAQVEINAFSGIESEQLFVFRSVLNQIQENLEKCFHSTNSQKCI